MTLFDFVLKSRRLASLVRSRVTDEYNLSEMDNLADDIILSGWPTNRETDSSVVISIAKKTA